MAFACNHNMSGLEPLAAVQDQQSILNPDTFLLVLSYLDVTDLLKVEGACRAWRRFVTGSPLWKRQYLAIEGLDEMEKDRLRDTRTGRRVSGPDIDALTLCRSVEFRAHTKASWRCRARGETCTMHTSLASLTMSQHYGMLSRTENLTT